FIDARRLILSSSTRAAKLSDDAGIAFVSCRKMYEATSLPASVTKTGPLDDESLASASRVFVAPASVSGDQSEAIAAGAGEARCIHRSRLSQATAPMITSRSAQPSRARQPTVRLP